MGRRAAGVGLLLAACALPGWAEASTTATTSSPLASLFAPDPQGPLAQARLALEQKKPADAEVALKGFIGSTADVARWLRAQALAEQGKDSEALTELRALPSRALGCVPPASDPLSIDPKVKEAELLAKRDPAAAAQLLSTLPPDGARFLTGIRLYQKAGQAAAANALEQRLLLEIPEAPESLAVAKDRGKVTALGPELRLARAFRLLDANVNEEARDEASALLSELPKDAATRCELGYILGKAQRKLRSYKTAIEALELARTSCPEGKDWALKAALLELQVRAIRGQVKAGKATLQWILNKYERHSYADDAIYTYAETAERAGQLKVAAPLYQKLIDDYGDGDQATAAAWRLAFSAIESEDATAAEKHLRFILRGNPARIVDREQARYWLAQVLEKKQPTEAEALYLGLTETPTFYTWLAIDRLGRSQPKLAEAMKVRLWTAVQAPVPTFVPAPRIANDPRFLAARSLAAAGLPILAAAELERLTCDKLEDQELLTVAFALDAVAAHPRAQALLRGRPGLLSGSFRAESVPVWRAAYSRPYLELITAAAKAEKVEPLLLHALVREESTFDPKIVSWAGATGLAQLMPATAIGAYATVYRGRLDLARLTEPELNLRLGAHVLRLGMKSFDKTEPLALGAYNGGAGLVERFLGKEPVPFDRWIERFGVRETRRYMQRVTETWGLYRLLYDPLKPWISLPENVGPPAASRD